MTERAPHHPTPDVVDTDPPIEDAALLDRVARGDTRALRHLYEAHAGWVAGRLRRKLPPDAVEDVLQETLLAVWRGAGRYRGDGDVGGWIWGIARFRMARWHRDRGQEAAGVVDERVPDAGDLAAEAADRLDLRPMSISTPSGTASPARSGRPSPDGWNAPPRGC